MFLNVLAGHALELDGAQIDRVGGTDCGAAQQIGRVVDVHEKLAPNSTWQTSSAMVVLSMAVAAIITAGRPAQPCLLDGRNGRSGSAVHKRRCVGSGVAKASIRREPGRFSSCQTLYSAGKPPGGELQRQA
jgi:hypothetical protein